MRISDLKWIRQERDIRHLIEQEIERTGGIFRLAPTWVGRPGIVQPGRRIKLLDDDMSQSVFVNERWFASVTYADNGVHNRSCPEDHGLSYLVIGNNRVQLREALAYAPDMLLNGKKWDVLPKFFDNWHRIPHHMHPCGRHVRPGLVGKPESYHFPVELNMNRNAFPHTAVGVDAVFSDTQIMSHLQRYFKGDNRLTDLSLTINLTPGTGYFMPPCTLHAPGSLVTYELQTASDVTCIPESRVNDMVMPPDLLDRDLPVSIERDGIDTVCAHLLSMLRCPDSGNAAHFRKEYSRPPVVLHEEAAGVQSYVIYRCGKASAPRNPDLYSAKRTVVHPGHTLAVREQAAFGGIVLSGHGAIRVEGREPLPLETAAIYVSRDDIGGDEFFVAACAAGKVRLECRSLERLALYQHFASDSNPQACTLAIPEFVPFAD
jgi:hypothetical protein